jgi:methylmalonyl-CoA mutase
VGLPTDTSARIARNTQLVIQEESQVCHVVDPLGGSYYIEALTGAVIKEARKIIDEVEELGGMAKAIETGMPKMRIEESAARRQARIDQGLDVIVGVNKFQIEGSRWTKCWKSPHRSRRTGGPPAGPAIGTQSASVMPQPALLEGSPRPPKAAATFWRLHSGGPRTGHGGRDLRCHGKRVRPLCGHHPVHLRGLRRRISGQEVIAALRKRTEQFMEKQGRRPRILMTKMGQDGHDRGIKVVATAFADFGFDVDISPMFQTPEEAAKMAVENDVHLVGVSSLAAGHKTLVPQLSKALSAQGAGDIKIIVGGVIPPSDYDFLKTAGAVCVFGPGTPLITSANQVLNALEG